VTMSNVIPLTNTIRPAPDDPYWSVYRENMSLTGKLISQQRLMRYFAEGICEYANQRGDSYLADEAQRFLQLLE
jgi:hypothetical protein